MMTSGSGDDVFYRSSDLELWQPSCSAEQSHFKGDNHVIHMW